MVRPWSSGEAPELFAGGTVKVRDEASGTERVASGLWHVKRAGAELDVVLTLPSERYVAMAVAGETDAREPVESLKAMAVVARTYALNGSHYSARPGHLAAELCDSTQCQALRWGAGSAHGDEAVRATAGETLWAGGKRAEVYFSGSCGGQTEDAAAVWPALKGLGYLRGHADPFCVRRDGGAKWHAELTLAELTGIARAEGWKLPAQVSAVRVVERSASGRALRVLFTGNGESDAVTASTLRFGIGRALGFGRVRSDWYEAGVRGKAMVFDGRGHGHGVGLCQDGATEMAAEGKSAGEILAFYFPGTVVGISPRGDVWSESLLHGLRVLAVGRPPDVQASWLEAQKRFAGGKAVTPTVVFAPTVEIFRQRSGEPGWMLASTRGTEIVVEPSAVVGNSMPATLLHEMLHVLVESEASPSAPLWLREGLVEVLSGERGGGAMSEAEMEAELANPGSRQTSEKAHRAAAAKVKAMIGNFGAGTVRGWLRTGPPASV
jgi:stage II sporulation protein D